MNLLHLKYACEVERCGSINQAARNLYLSQPYLSSCLQSLEQSFHVVLFSRSSRGVAPTQQGKEFLTMAKALLEQAERMEQRYASGAAGSQTFQVTSIRTMVALHAYLKFYGRCMAGMPCSESGYYEASFDDVVDGVYHRAFSLGLMMYYTGQREFIENYARLRDLHFVEVGSVPLHIIFSRRHPMARKKHLTGEDVRGMAYVTYSDFKHSILDLENECRLIDMEPPRRLIYVHDRHSLMNTLAAMDCFTLAQRFTREDEEKYDLVSIPSKSEKYRVHFGYIYPAGSVFAPESNERSFIRIYEETVRKFAAPR